MYNFLPYLFTYQLTININYCYVTVSDLVKEVHRNIYYFKELVNDAGLRSVMEYLVSFPLRSQTS